MAKEYYEYDTEKKELTPMGKEEKKKKLFLSKIDKWKVFKKVTSMAASGCASAMINRYFKANLPEANSIAEKVITSVGIYFVTGMVGEKVAEYVENEVEDWRVSISKDNISEMNGGDEDGGNQAE